MILSDNSQLEEAKAAESVVGISLCWLREVDIACELYFFRKGITHYTFREKIAMDAKESQARKLARG
jgi:hypothetical protein